VPNHHLLLALVEERGAEVLVKSAVPKQVVDHDQQAVSDAKRGALDAASRLEAVVQLLRLDPGQRADRRLPPPNATLRV
jgi:hypothetical protein